MKKLSLILLILSVALIVGCSSNEPSIKEVSCNAGTVGTSVPDDCNTCICQEFNGVYSWACTENGCILFS